MIRSRTGWLTFKGSCVPFLDDYPPAHLWDVRVSRVRGKLSLLAAAALLAGAANPQASTAESALKDSGLVFQPQLGAPGLETVIGASPGEAPGEVWATGSIGSVPATVAGPEIANTRVLLRRSSGNGWQIIPAPEFSGTPRVTDKGGVVMLSSETAGQTIITRDPGGAFIKAAEPPLLGGEKVSNGAQLPLLTALDEPAHTGALLVPAVPSAETLAVLHFDGTGWAHEPICEKYVSGACTPPAQKMTMMAIAASSPQNAWLLASRPDRSLALFKRTFPAGAGGVAVWEQSSWAAENQPLSARNGGQMLTVTSGGVWVDATYDGHADVSLLLDASSPSHLLGEWCYPQECAGASLGAALPRGEYRSFASPSGGALGTRIITGLPGGGLLRFQGGGDFRYVVGVSGTTLNAEFLGESLEEGWLSSVSFGRDGAKVERVSASPEVTLGAQQAWPLPFRRPLLAIAQQPGSSSGDPGAQAIAVGDQGQIARYMPGVGWSPEFLYDGYGRVQRPRLRGVAWPEPGRAYAVGDEGAMWLWRSDTGLWEPDPAAPLGLHANLTAIAFSPLDPAVGYAVGKQGALLAYDKTWTQQALPPGLQQANFTSVAFAYGDALATYRMVQSGSAGPEGEVGGLIVNDGSGWRIDPSAQALLARLPNPTASVLSKVAGLPDGEVGGLIVNDGSGWRIDPSAQALLARLPNPTASVLSKVAGLPDGGAAAAGPGIVIERDSAGSGWRFSREPLPEAQNVSALAAIRAGAEVRALVSIDLEPRQNPNDSTKLLLEIDNLPPPALGQPLALVAPDPLPATGYLLQETGEGWHDLEQQAYPRPAGEGVREDLPAWPDAVLALDVDPSGSVGWAVGGQTGGQFLEGGGGVEIQSARALRLGSGATPPQSTAPIGTPAGQATFAVGGNAQCAGPCVSLLNEGLGPDVWLSGAVGTAARIPGLHAFLYTGARVAEGASGRVSPEEFVRELDAYRDDLAAGGSLPVRTAASPSDRDSRGTLAAFESVLGSYAPAGSAPAGTSAYAFDSSGAGGTVRVIALDYSAPGLGQVQLRWLEEQLEHARSEGVPTIVMGNADVVSRDGAHAPDAASVERALLRGGASAYIFDSPNENRKVQIGSGSNAIPAFGTGTLGYVPDPLHAEEFLGASGFLLVSVDTAHRASNNRAPVTATLTPNIAQLALNATDGTLLRRSQPALFEGLARRAFAGSAWIEKQVVPDPYVPVPETCVGSACGAFIEPSYTFHSSNEEIGDFVQPESARGNRAVLQGPDGKPIHDEHSGLFCAYNPGTTTVSLTTGGLTFSEQVTVQAGSVEQPCGTVPLKNPPVETTATGARIGALPSTPPASSPTTPIIPVPPPPPLAPVPAKAPPPPPHRAAPPPPTPFLAKPPLFAALIALPLLPPPAAARPIPPSGTSAVTQPAVKEEEEDEEAIESARNAMAVYQPHSEDRTLAPVSLILLVLIAAAAGTGIHRRGRRRSTPAFARSGVPPRGGPW